MEESEEKKKKSIFKKWWFWVIIVIIVIAFSGDTKQGMQDGFNDAIQSQSNSNTISSETPNNVNKNPINENKENIDVETTPKTEPKTIIENSTTEEKTTTTVTLGQKNALSSAKSYLNVSAFSYNGLKEQLKYEGYSDEEATYAVDNCGADWNEQASKSAKSYMNISSFSKSGLIDQLKYEGFTAEQAEYGASAVGY